MINRRAGIAFVAGMVLSGALAPSTEAHQTSPYVRDLPNVFDGIARNLAGSPEVSTAELRAALEDSGAIVLDARPYEEYAVSHIPGARTVPGKPGTTPALYVAEATEIAKAIPEQTQPLILTATVSSAAAANGPPMT
jgi:rhodanese-related sulfurtransferase